MDVIYECSQTQKKSKWYFLSRPLGTKIPFTKGDLLVGKWLDMCMLDDGLLLHHGTQWSWGMDQSKKILEYHQGKKLRLKNILKFPSKSEGITCRRQMPSNSAKNECKMPSHFRWKKKELPFWQITFHPLKLGSKDFYQISDKKHKFFLFYRYVTFDPDFKGWKVICQRGNSFFYQKSEGLLHLLFA